MQFYLIVRGGKNILPNLIVRSRSRVFFSPLEPESEPLEKNTLLFCTNDKMCLCDKKAKCFLLKMFCFRKRGRPSISKEEGAKKIKLALEAKKIKLDFRHAKKLHKYLFLLTMILYISYSAHYFKLYSKK